MNFQPPLAPKYLDGVLQINGERKHECSDKEQSESKDKFYKKGRYHGTFHQSVLLPEDIDNDSNNISAKYQDGVLSISIPKKETAQETQIKIM